MRSYEREKNDRKTRPASIQQGAPGRLSRKPGADFTDKRPEASIQKNISGLAGSSPRTLQMHAIQQMADQRGHSSPQLTSGKGILIYHSAAAARAVPPLQGVFIYTFPAGTIVNSPKTAAEVMRFGFKPVTIGEITVWCDERNMEDAGRELSRVYAKLIKTQPAEKQMESEPQVVLGPESYELIDEDLGLSFIYKGKVYSDRLMVKQKGESLPDVSDLSSVFDSGKVFCISGESLEEPGEMIKITPKMIRDYWETPKESEEDMSTQGSFAGYSAKEGQGPDWRYNCAAYAHGSKSWIEPEAMHKILGEDYEEIESYTAMVVGKEYVLATQFHFIRITKLEADKYKTSEKNGPSAVYEKTLDTEGMIELVEKYSSVKLYKRK